MPINRPENPCSTPDKMSSATDQLIYEAIIAMGGFVNDFVMIVPQPENIGFEQPPYSSNTKALLYELILAAQAGGGGGGGTTEVFVEENL